MPSWAATIIAIAAVVSALVVIWQKVLRPLTRGLASFDRNVPVLLEIASQFRSDSGSTLRDVVNRLEAAATENKHTNDSLRASAEGARQLAVSDRERVDRLIVLLAQLDSSTVKRDTQSLVDRKAAAASADAVSHAAIDAAAAIAENTAANLANTEALTQNDQSQ